MTPFRCPSTYYVYDGDKAILEYSSTGAIVGKNVYGRHIDEILMRTDPLVNSGQPFYYQEDHEGSVTHLTNASGAVIESYRYDAFGKPTINGNPNLSSSPLGNRFMFTGREYISQFGIYEYRARTYNPTIGRFMGEDPKGFDAGDYNLFRYCKNEPEDLTDPTGMMLWPVGVSPIVGDIANANNFAAVKRAFNAMLAQASLRQTGTGAPPKNLPQDTKQAIKTVTDLYRTEHKPYTVVKWESDDGKRSGITPPVVGKQNGPGDNWLETAPEIPKNTHAVWNVHWHMPNQEEPSSQQDKNASRGRWIIRNTSSAQQIKNYNQAARFSGTLNNFFGYKTQQYILLHDKEETRYGPFPEFDETH